MILLEATTDIAPITNLITNWIHIGQALVGSIGALAFVFALLCKGKPRLQFDRQPLETRGAQVKPKSALP